MKPEPVAKPSKPVTLKFEIGIFLGMLLVLLSALLAFVGVFPQFRLVTARYAPGYSEAAFDRIKEGDSLESVREALGAPMEARTNQGVISWSYAEPKWTFWYNDRVILLTNGTVFLKVRGQNNEW